MSEERGKPISPFQRVADLAAALQQQPGMTPSQGEFYVAVADLLKKMHQREATRRKIIEQMKGELWKLRLERLGDDDSP